MKLRSGLSKEEQMAKKEFQIQLGGYLKDQRETAGLSQKQISDLIGLDSAQFISNIERGTCAVPNHILKVMINQYDLNQKELLNFIAELKMKFYTQVLFSKKKKDRSA